VTLEESHDDPAGQGAHERRRDHVGGSDGSISGRDDEVDAE
jgi:hypothetical protein